jgi:hypothetical protein
MYGVLELSESLGQDYQYARFTNSMMSECLLTGTISEQVCNTGVVKMGKLILNHRNTFNDFFRQRAIGEGIVGNL